MGVAVAVGAGIFSVGAKAAANFAGPAVTISFAIAAVTCALAIMCYAEFATAIPVAGSAYVFTYATMGEILAWIIGWNLILELLHGRRRDREVLGHLPQQSLRAHGRGHPAVDLRWAASTSTGAPS